MRLIDADELLESIEETTWYHIFKGKLIQGANGETDIPLYKASDIYSVLDAAPTVDAEPVVRCEDCIWHRERNKKEQAYLIEGVLICTNVEATDGGWLPVFPTHFCSYGERKDGGAND